MQILRNIQTDITPLSREARMVQLMILTIMQCGQTDFLGIRMELLRGGVVVTIKELTALMESMDRQGDIKFNIKRDETEPGKAPENGLSIAK